MRARALMVQGTASHVGKSVVATALCRIYARRGLSVAPFKAQNLSNNSAVCPDGSEIGRAQALQARAAGIEPTAEMNPVLLKPTAGAGCQVVAMGRLAGYGKRALWPVARAALARLRKGRDLLVVEGAGSPAEPNLMRRDMANMRVARSLKCPVLLVADIDRGGAFAAVVGTLALLPPRDRRLVRGWVLNRFRGDARGLRPAVRRLERRIGKPCVGVIPFLRDLGLDEEDAEGLEERKPRGQGPRIAVLRFPHLSNFTDFLALERDGSEVRYVDAPAGVKGADAVILPGSRHTLADLAWLRARGFESALKGFRGPIVGICGGFQMMGESLDDPHGADGGRPGRSRGLGLLPVRTSFGEGKRTRRVSVVSRLPFSGASVSGYEIHLGVTRGRVPEAFRILPGGEPDGAVSGRAWGTYLHGLFDAEGFRRAFLRSLVRRRLGFPRAPGDPLNRWADHVAAHLDLARINAWIGL